MASDLGPGNGPLFLSRRWSCVQENLRPVPRVVLPPENLRTLGMALCNSRSLSNKIIIFNEVISSQDLDLLFLTETWLPPSDVSAFS